MIINSYREKSNSLHTSNYLADSLNTVDVMGHIVQRDNAIMTNAQRRSAHDELDDSIIRTR